MKAENIRRLVDQFGWSEIMRVHRLHTVDGEGTTAIADYLGTVPRVVEQILRCARYRIEAVQEGQQLVDTFDVGP